MREKVKAFLDEFNFVILQQRNPLPFDNFGKLDFVFNNDGSGGPGGLVHETKELHKILYQEYLNLI